MSGRSRQGRCLRWAEHLPHLLLHRLPLLCVQLCLLLLLRLLLRLQQQLLLLRHLLMVLMSLLLLCLLLHWQVAVLVLLHLLWLLLLLWFPSTVMLHMLVARLKWRQCSSSPPPLRSTQCPSLPLLSSHPLTSLLLHLARRALIRLAPSHPHPRHPPPSLPPTAA